MRLKLLAIVALTTASSSLEAGRAPPHSTRWVVLANDTPPGTVVRNKDGYFRIGTIAPARLYRPAQTISVVTKKGHVVLPAGKLFAPLQDDPRKFCEIRNSKGSAFDCLFDTDRDGKADTYFGTQVFNEIFLGSIGDDGGFAPLASPVDLAEVDPKSQAPQIDLELKFDGMSDNIVKYRLCMKTSWRSKYYDERSCLRRTIQAQMDASRSALIHGQKVRFDRVRDKPPSVYVEYGREYFEFPTSFSLH
jgi:hypothetical protein